MKKIPTKPVLFLLLTLALILFATLPIQAGSTTGDLPFNQGLDKLYQNFKGPTGTALLLMAIIWGLVKWSGSERGSSGLIQAAKAGVSLAIIVGLLATLTGLGIAAASL